MRKVFDWLPNCMYELTGCKYICPRYWILEKAKARKLWNNALWITCMKEIKRRLNDKNKRKDEWTEGKIWLFIFCTFYVLEKSSPLITINWSKWKRKLFFNPLMDRIVDFIIDRL